MDKKSLELVAKTLNALNMIWFSLFFSVLLYVVAGIALKEFISVELGEKTLHYVRTFFYLISLVNITYAVYIRNKYVGKAKQKKSMEEVLKTYREAVIVSVSLGSMIGVYGFLLLVAGDRFYAFPLAITSGLLMLYLKPRRGELLSLLE